MASFYVANHQLNGNKLEMQTKETIPENENIYIILKDRILNKELFYKPLTTNTHDGSTNIKLDLSSIDFYRKEKNIYDLFFLIGNQKYRALSQNIQLQRKSSRYCTNLYKINNAEVAVPYLTVENNLSILYGNASAVFKEYCSEIKPKETVNASVLNEDKFMSFEFDSFLFSGETSFLGLHDDENESYVSIPYIQDEKNPNRIWIDIEKYPVYKRRHKLVVKQKIRNVLVILNLNFVTNFPEDKKVVNNFNPDSTERAVIKSHMTIKNLTYNNRKMLFELDDASLPNVDNCHLFLRDKNERIYSPEINYKKRSGKIIFEINLVDFISKYAKEVSRWSFYMTLEHDYFIEENRLGLYDTPSIPSHERYFNDKDMEDNHIITPYLTIKNGLSIVITTNNSLNNEMLQPDTSVRSFKKGRNKGFSGSISLKLKECENFKVEYLVLKYRNEIEKNEYFFDISEHKETKNDSLITFKINLSDLSFEQYHWDIFLQVNIDNNKYLIRVKNPLSNLSESIKKEEKKYCINLGDDFILYPYITINNGFSLTYRQKEKHEGAWYQLKEYLAYFLYKIFKRRLHNKQIWLVYEKFSQTAQDNSYYFFKYAYENHPEENIYYIIDKHSPDYVNVKGMEDRIVPFMSIKHLMYLYASKLFVASEAKGHAHIMRKQNGKLKNIISNKKLVFLQHGVLGLKKVSSIFRNDGKSGATLFVTSSEWEKNIVEENFKYNKEDIIVTGLCRWDALIDESKNRNKKEIMFMPTWRSWLDGVSDSKFIKSDYYLNYETLLKSTKLQEILQDHDITINFYIHPKFKAYIDKFETNNKNIKIYQFGEEKVNRLLMRSSLLITDYSSVAWDQYYQKKPIIFYQFDRKTYEQLQGSYMDMDKDLFGDCIFEVDQLIHAIEDYINKDFVEKDKYAAMRYKYFQHVDQHNSKRIFTEIVNNKKKLGLE